VSRRNFGDAPRYFPPSVALFRRKVTTYYELSRILQSTFRVSNNSLQISNNSRHFPIPTLHSESRIVDPVEKISGARSPHRNDFECFESRNAGLAPRCGMTTMDIEATDGWIKRPGGRSRIRVSKHCCRPKDQVRGHSIQGQTEPGRGQPVPEKPVNAGKHMPAIFRVSKSEGGCRLAFMSLIAARKRVKTENRDSPLVLRREVATYSESRNVHDDHKWPENMDLPGKL
jgi:hypothetical protein